jgi:CheY-like chemotaxis protein
VSHKLLLADDSVTIQRVIELTFAEEDVQVLTAGDGEQAIQRVQADHPDIVLADIGMPKRSGYEVAAFIKGHADFSHIPVLLLTGAFEPVDEARVHAAGCDGVLVKPFEPQHVITRVRELLQGARGPSALHGADVPRPVDRLAPHRAEVPATRDPQEPLASADKTGADFDFGGPATTPRANGEAALDDYFDRLDAAFANISTAGAAQEASEQPEQTEVDEPQVLPRPSGPVMEKELDWFDSSSPPLEGPASHGASGFPSTQFVPDRHVIDQEPQADLVARHVMPDPTPAPSIGPSAGDSPTTFANPPSTSEWPVPGVVEGLIGGVRHPEPPPPEPPDQSPTISPAPAMITALVAAAPAAVAPPARAPEPEARPASETRAAPATPATTTVIAEAFSALLAVEQGEPGAVPVRLVTGPAVPEITDELIEEITRRVIERLAPGAVRDVVSDVVAQVAERLVREEITRLRHR